MAHWVTTEVAGKLRTNSSDWRESYQDYLRGVIEETTPYQITQGGPVIAVQIDNEYNQTFDGGVGGEYYDDLEDIYRDSDIVVPWTYNNAGMVGNFINGTGAVDLYGVDDYPQRYDCAHPYDWKEVKQVYREFHLQSNPWQPFFFPEFQGGSGDAWGPGAPGYLGCQILTGPDWMNVVYKHLWSINAKLLSYYMMYGGTSWGAIPFHGVRFDCLHSNLLRQTFHIQHYTSYDWGGAISENRTLSPKYEEFKREGYFIRSSADFYKTEWMGDSNATHTPYIADILSNPKIFVTLLKNPDTEARFYISRQNDSTSTAINDFKINVSTSLGELELPVVALAITMGGRQSKIILTDYTFGSASKLLYSTAELYFAGSIDGRDVILLYGDAVQEHEFALEFTGREHSSLVANSSALTYTDFLNSTTIVSVTNGSSGLFTVYDSTTQLVLFADTHTATSFYAPTIAGDSSNPFRNYWSLGSNESVLVGGAYLVRTADIMDGTLILTGDVNKDTILSIVAPAAVSSILWNGASLDLEVGVSAQGGWTAVVPFVDPQIILPKLEGWKYRDSLPELLADYDDSAWRVANRTTTNIPQKPLYGDDRVLYGCDYGFCENIVLWRGHFNSTGEQKSVNLSINGGQAFAASVWLNDSSANANKIEERDEKFIFPEGALNLGDNVITIVQDNMGLNETGDLVNVNGDVSKNPRGVRGFELDTGAFGDWKVQGKVGGYNGFLDRHRGIVNEGGLFGERAGWHLPGFDTSAWTSRNIQDGLPDDKAGVGFFVTTFELDLPVGYDIPLSFSFEETLGQNYRVYFWANGWMMGKRIANLGPQWKFAVHEGILDYHGTNTVAVALWAMEGGEGIKPDFQLTMDNVWQGGLLNIQTENPRWSADGREPS
ncbi:beta-galactosidase, domain 2-domain-containing protein [Mucidula mucida]|nr:beta-galactosidase, domain 2-domain-containing protein [Mucidula mucida]